MHEELEMITDFVRRIPYEVILKNGGRKEIWAIFENQIGEFIKANDIAPLSKEGQMNLAFASMSAPVETVAMKEGSAVFPIWWYGGMKAAHLHFQGKVYVLKLEQWNRFVAPMLKEFAGKLRLAKTVSFDKMMELSEAITDMV
jgi:hypothetical protein